MAQWVHLYEMDDDTFKIIVKTFCSVFPEVTLWSLGGNDALLLGARCEMEPDFAASEKAMASPDVRFDLARFRLHDLFTLLSLQIASSPDIQNSVHGESLVNRDYFPLLEYRAPRALYTTSFVGAYMENLDERRFSLDKYDLLLRPYLRDRGISSDNLLNLLIFLKGDLGRYNRYLSLPVIDRLHRQMPDDGMLNLAYTSSGIPSLRENIRNMAKRIREGDKDPELPDLYASSLIRRYSLLRSFFTPEIFHETLSGLRLCARLSEHDKAKFYNFMAEICRDDRDYEKAIEYDRASRELK
jgi:hypothetical protein